MGKKKHNQQLQRKRTVVEPEPDPIRQLTAGIPPERIWLIAIAVVTLVAAALRLYHLDFNSIWLDEGTTYVVSSQSFSDILTISINRDFHPPLFRWMEHIVIMTIGTSEWALRILPAIIGIATVPLFYLIGKELRDDLTGIIGAVLLTVSPFHIYYSQEAYAYSMLLFGFSICMWCALRGMNGDQRMWYYSGIAGAATVWAHYYAAIPIIVFYGSLLVFKYDCKRAIGAFLVPVVPLGIVMIQRYFVLTASAPTYGVLGWVLFPETFIRFSGGNAIVGLLVVIAFVIGDISLYGEKKRISMIMICTMCVPIILSILISLKMTMNPRYLIPLLAVLYPVIGCVRIGSGDWKVPVVTGVIVALCFTSFLPAYYTTYTKEDWRGLSAMLYNQTLEGDSVVTVPAYMSQPLDYYYSNLTDGTREWGASNVSTITNVTTGGLTFYVVTGDIAAADPSGETIAWLQEHSEVVNNYNGAYLMRCI